MVLCLFIGVLAIHATGQSHYEYTGGGVDPADWQDPGNWNNIDGDPQDYPGNEDHWVEIDPNGADIAFHNLPLVVRNFRPTFFITSLTIKASPSGGSVRLSADNIPNINNGLYIFGYPVKIHLVNGTIEGEPDWNVPLAFDIPPSGSHLFVEAGTTLILGGIGDHIDADGNNNAEWLIPASSNAAIWGTLILWGGETNPADVSFTAMNSGGINFENGSLCQIGVIGRSSTLFSTTVFPFGTGIPNGTHIYKTGSRLVVCDGLSPFGQQPSNTIIPTIHKIDMQPGSTFEFNNQINGNAYRPDMFGRTFGNYTYSVPFGKEVQGRSARLTIYNKLRVTNEIVPALRFMNNNVGSTAGLIIIHEGIEVPNANHGIITNEFLHFAPSSATGLEPGPDAGQLQVYVEEGASAEITGQSTIFFSERANFRLEANASLVLNSYIRKNATSTVSGTNSLSNIGLNNNAIIRFRGESYIRGTNSARIATSLNNIIEIESVNGIHISGNIGHLRMDEWLVLNTSTHFIYRGSVAQLTGDGLGNTTGGGGFLKRITIDNPAGVTLSHDLSTSQLILTNGLFNLNGRTLTVRPPDLTDGPGNFGRLIVNDGNFAAVNGTTSFLGRNNVEIDAGKGDIEFRRVLIAQLSSSSHLGRVDFGNVAGSTPVINTLLQLNTGGLVVNNPPRYAANSTLVYNTGNRTVGTEWTPNQNLASVRGVPHHVQIRDATNTILTIPASTYYQALGNVYQRGTTTNNSAQVTIASGGELRLMGNWVRDNSPSIVQNGRFIVFNGSLNQQIQQTTDTTITFERIRIDKSGGNLVLNNAFPARAVILNGNGNALEISNGDIDVNGGRLDIAGLTPHNIVVRNGNRRIFSAGSGTVGMQNALKTVVDGGSAGRLIFDIGIRLSMSSPFDFGTNLTTVNDTLFANPAFSATNAPFYGPQSTLRYHNVIQDRNIGAEWQLDRNLSTQAGVPQNVQIAGGSTTSPWTVSFPGTLGGYRQVLGDISITNGGTGTLTFALGTGSGSSADLRVGGNWLRGSNTAFQGWGRAVTFNGAANQTITNTTAAENFTAIAVNKSAGNVILNNTDLTINGTSGNVIHLQSGTIDLNGRLLRLTGNGGTVLADGGVRTIVNNHATDEGIFRIIDGANEGKVFTASGVGARLDFGSNVLVETNNTGANIINFNGNAVRIDGRLRIRGNGGAIQNGPDYGPNSILQYSTGATRTISGEWNTNASGPGVPMHVQVGVSGAGNLSTLTIDAGTRTARGNISIGDAGGGTGYALTLSGGSTQLNVGGNWQRYANGAFSHGNRPVEFNGSANATIQAPMPAGESFHTLNFNKDDIANTITTNSLVQITSTLNLTRGRVLSSYPNNLLHLTNTALAALNHIVPSGTNGAYIEGPFRRSTGNLTDAEAMLFPVGQLDGATPRYAPFWLSDVSFATGAEFTGRYHVGIPPGQDPLFPHAYFFAGTINGILSGQYWEFARTAGVTSTARLVLDYNSSMNFMNIFSGPTPPSAPGTDEISVVRLRSNNTWDYTGLPGLMSPAAPVAHPELTYFGTDRRVSTVSTTPFTGPHQPYFSLGWSDNNILVLPIRLLSFWALLQNTDALLNWEVADAAEVQSFEVEYSTNGERFTKIATIPKGGTMYSYRHTKLAPGMHYYRLHMISKDGTRAYSAVELVQLGGEKTFIRGLHQNPVQGGRALIKVYSPTAQDAEAIVVDNLGRVLLRTRLAIPAGDNQVPLSVLPLSGGMYRLLLRTRDGVEKTLPFVR